MLCAHLQKLLWFGPRVCFSSMLQQFIIIAKSISNSSWYVYSLRRCLFLCTSCHQSHLMFPFPTPHPHSCLTTDCHKFACFSLLCVSRVYYKIFIKSQRSDLSQSSLHDITMRSICNHKVNQRHMEANAQTKYDLCCCNIWLVQRSEECLARPRECAMWL